MDRIHKEKVDNKNINNNLFFIQLQLAEKDREINDLASHLETLSREKVLSNALQ